MLIEERANRPADQILHDVRAIRDYRESADPAKLPVEEYRNLSATPLRDIMRALTTADLSDDEYAQLVKFAIGADDDIQQSIIRSKDEFAFLRQHLGVSQQWVADQLGVSISTVRRWEDLKSDYSPSIKAWRRLDELDKWERDTAATALNGRIEYLDGLILSDKHGVEIFGENERLRACRMDITVVLHHFRSEDDYRETLRKVDSTRVAYDEDGMPFDPEDIDEDEANRECLSAWSVFREADSYMVQNAITSIMYEMIRAGSYTEPKSGARVVVSFVRDSNESVDFNLPVFIVRAWEDKGKENKNVAE